MRALCAWTAAAWLTAMSVAEAGPLQTLWEDVTGRPASVVEAPATHPRVHQAGAWLFYRPERSTPPCSHCQGSRSCCQPSNYLMFLPAQYYGPGIYLPPLPPEPAVGVEPVPAGNVHGHGHPFRTRIVPGH